MSSRDAHTDACEGLHAAVRHLEHGNLEIAAVHVLASSGCAAAAAAAGALPRADDLEIQRAARAILLAIVRRASEPGATPTGANPGVASDPLVI